MRPLHPAFRGRRLATFVVAMAVALTLGSPAQAAWVSQETGTIACGSNNIAVRIRHTAHLGSVYVPGGTLQDTNWIDQGTVTWTETTLESGTKTWKAAGSYGALVDTVGTYAYCWGN